MTDIDPYKPPEAGVAVVSDGSERVYFTVGSLKLAALSICTLGLYELYWCYRNWKCVKHRLDSGLMPFWRAFFAPLWGFSLATRIREHRQEIGLSPSLSPLLAGGAYLALSVTWRLPDPYWLISMFTFVPLLAMQDAADEVAVSVNGDENPFTRLNPWNWVGLIVGGLFLALALVGTFLPPVES